ncbi:MFS transporter [Dactylosporangium sp. McL0621]|uniref:MFS transporter n=1 Tax=Dactylosporangium sp. McL0621 TaxID=3415678 RepID=UPI003CE762F9
MRAVTNDPDQSAAPNTPALWTASFRLFFAARLVSLLGDAMLVVAIPVVVLQSGYGVSVVGYVFGGWMAAVAVCTVFGGALSDRLGPRTTMVGADVARFVVQAVMAVPVIGGTVPLWSLVLLQVLGGAASALFAPGSGSIVPRLTTRLREANASVKVAEALTAVIGPGIAGVLISMIGGGSVMWVTALQTHVPQSVQGRVFAYDIAGSLIVLSAGRILAGPAAWWLGDRGLMALGGVVAVACCAVLLAIPAVRRLPAISATTPATDA